MPEQYFEVQLLKPARSQLEQLYLQAGFERRYDPNDRPGSTPIFGYKRVVKVQSGEEQIDQTTYQSLLSYGVKGLWIHRGGLEHLAAGRQEVFLETLETIPIIKSSGVVDDIRREYNLK